MRTSPTQSAKDFRSPKGNSVHQNSRNGSTRKAPGLPNPGLASVRPQNQRVPLLLHLAVTEANQYHEVLDSDIGWRGGSSKGEGRLGFRTYLDPKIYVRLWPSWIPVRRLPSFPITRLQSPKANSLVSFGCVVRVVVVGRVGWGGLRWC